uniref:YqaJ viral recombinase domain-containing protein n=1 Tax=Cacopsylla melanoneura TaxID=428564 RepID=A0A8D8X7W9_9HEMI
MKQPASSNVAAETIATYVNESRTVVASESLLGRQLGKVQNEGSLHYMMSKFKKALPGSDAEAFISYCSQEMSSSVCKNIASKTEDQALSPLWREMRYGRITASKLYEASRCSTTEGSLVNAILGASKVKNNVAMERGIRLEKDVLKEVERKLSIKINRSGLILIPENPIFGASPDGISENAVFEVKCPVSEKSFKTYFNDDETMPADKYLAQIMLQMYMCNKDLGFFCVARPCFEKSKDILILKVVYNEAWLQSVMIKAKEFWISSLFPKLNVSA